MSLESFGGFDSSEPMDAASLEKLREKMRKAAAQIKALKKEESRRKKSENELHAILLKFIKSSNKTRLVLAISKALAENLPANFLLAVVLLGNTDIQKEINLKLMPGPEEEVSETALVLYAGKSAMPLRVRLAIDNWLKNILYQAGENPHKLLKNAYDVEENEKVVKKVLVQLFALVIEEFLAAQNVRDDGKGEEFASYMLGAFLQKTEEALAERKELS